MEPKNRAELLHCLEAFINGARTTADNDDIGIAGGSTFKNSSHWFTCNFSKDCISVRCTLIFKHQIKGPGRNTNVIKQWIQDAGTSAMSHAYFVSSRVENAGVAKYYLLMLDDRLIVAELREVRSIPVLLGRHDLHATFRRYPYTLAGIRCAFSLMPKVIVPTSFSQKRYGMHGIRRGSGAQCGIVSV